MTLIVLTTLLLSFTLCKSWSVPSQQKCMTESGKACIFPFVYKGEEHSGCVTADSSHDRLWCAHKVDPQTNELVPGSWGYCNPGCPTDTTGTPTTTENPSEPGCTELTTPIIIPNSSEMKFTNNIKITIPAKTLVLTPDDVEISILQETTLDIPVEVSISIPKDTEINIDESDSGKKMIHAPVDVTITVPETTTTSSVNTKISFTNTCRTTTPPPESCMTKSGPDAGKECQFPFKHNGITYNNCTKYIWRGEHYGEFWCSTKTDSDDRHINGHGYFGICEETPACGYNDGWW